MTGWRLQKITVADGLAMLWTKYGLVFLATIVLIVALLPTRYSMGLFDTALLGLKVLADLMRRIMDLLIMIVALPLSWLLSLFGDGEGGDLRPTPSLDVLTPPPEPRSPALFVGSHTRSGLLANVLCGRDLPDSQLPGGPS